MVVQQQGQSGALWDPAVGDTTRRLGRLLVSSHELPTDAAFAEIETSARRILARCEPPEGSAARRTGLVVGYVQSGKTMSMTTVASLARDNGFRVVIIFAGVTKNLMRQSRDRFESYLSPASGPNQSWVLWDTDRRMSIGRLGPELRDLLSEWADETTPEPWKRTLFVTVMKNHAHLRALGALFDTADMRGVPSLIIDDEADQAGLNTTPGEASPSTTHRMIAEVRDKLPHHSYLQYTATPQAPLLISLVDMLSPDFALVLDAGEAYTGGETFFRSASPLVATIPRSDLFDAGDPPSHPPPSLLRALGVFFVGAASLAGPLPDRWISMLVHPSQRQSDHSRFATWIRRVKQQWDLLLARPQGDPDRYDLLRDLEIARQELQQTIPTIEPLGELTSALQILLKRCQVTAVNSDSGDEVQWSNSPIHILVGGEKLNRGYTVKGLTVTYMPRGAGGWNADTIQQRARFLGYKAGYLGYCRVYLDPDVRDAYENYVEHESNVRRQLRQWEDRPLTGWKRAFLLDSDLRPTRRNVLRDPYYQIAGRAWHSQQRPHDASITSSNRLVVEQLLNHRPLEPYADGRHLSSMVPLAELYEKLLVDYSAVGDADVRWLWALRVWTEELIQRSSRYPCLLILMDGNRPPSDRTRVRSAQRGAIKQLFQGRDKLGFGNYPGDREMRDPDRLTIQVHRLQVDDDEQGRIDDVVALAAHTPSDFKDTLVRPPGPHEEELPLRA